MMLRNLFLLLAIVFAFGNLAAQSLAGERNADPAFMFSAGYGPQTTIGDIGDRFGNVWAIELGLDYLTGKANSWQFGLMGQFIFGTDVREDVLSGLRTSSGFIVGNQRDPADVQLRMRGYYGGVRIGKTFSFGGKNPRAGLKIAVGGGWLSHRIRIQNDPAQTVNQIIGEYRAGYDRLTEGPAAYQFIGYQQLSLNRRVNVFAGVEVIEGFTSNRRDYDFSSANLLEDDNRLDILVGVRAGLIIPFYIGEGREIFYR